MSIYLMINTALKRLMMRLRQLEIAYGYMLANAPTEEARRIVQINYETVKNSMDAIQDSYHKMNNVIMPPLSEALEEVPIFTTFNDAARYAFMEETQAIRMVKDLYLIVEPCYQVPLFGLLVEHQLNAMRLLYLI